MLVRINAADTPWYLDDIELLKHPGVRGFMVPKAEQLDEALVADCVEHGKLLIPLVETAVGFKNAANLAGSRAVARLAFGTIDFQVDLGIEGEDDALAHFRSQLVLESRLAQIQPPLDGVTVDINDAEVLRQDTLRAKRFGFGGKLCIHPRQVRSSIRSFRRPMRSANGRAKCSTLSHERMAPPPPWRAKWWTSPSWRRPCASCRQTRAASAGAATRLRPATVPPCVSRSFRRRRCDPARRVGQIG